MEKINIEAVRRNNKARKFINYYGYEEDYIKNYCHLTATQYLEMKGLLNDIAFINFKEEWSK